MELKITYLSWLAVFAAIGIAPAAAMNAIPILSGVAGQCWQFNSSYVSCVDGQRIPVTFAVSNPYKPLYGNFTAWQEDPYNVSMPMGILGSRCDVGSLSTVVCTVSLVPFSLLEGNGSSTRKVAIDFVSSSYPQVNFSVSFNITVHHYLNQSGGYLANLYESTYARYYTENETYSYFCGVYDICNSIVSGYLNQTQPYVYNAQRAITESELDQAAYNITTANIIMTGASAQFESFDNISNRIENNVIAADNAAGIAEEEYAANRSVLANCRAFDKSLYEEYANNTTASGTEPVTLNSSSGYLDGADSLLQNVRSSEASCKPHALFQNPIHINSMHLSGINLDFMKNVRWGAMGYIAFVALGSILIIYGRERFIESIEEKKRQSEGSV
jgi:hypothetical protein